MRRMALSAKRQLPRRLQWFTIVWLTIVWMALWGSRTGLGVVSGIVVAVVVSLVFPLPPLRLDLRLRPVPFLLLIATFVRDVVIASAQVAWVTLRRTPPRSALIEVDLKSQSDFVMTVVAEFVSLIPGSVVVEARRSTHTLLLHVLDVADTADVEAARTQVLVTEERVLKALNPRTEIDHGSKEEATG